MPTAHDTEHRRPTVRSTELLDLPLARARPGRRTHDQPVGHQGQRWSAVVALTGAAALIAGIALFDVGTDDERRYQSVRADRSSPFDDTDDTRAANIGGASVPRITAAPTDELVDGDPIRLTGWNFGPGVELSITQCVLGLFEVVSNCYQGHHRETISTGSDGSFELNVTARRLLRTDSAVLDCAALTAGRCTVVVVASEARSETATRIGGAVQLRYQRGVRLEPSATVDPPTAPAVAPSGGFEAVLDRSDGLRDGDRVALIVHGGRPGATADVQLCGSTTPAGRSCPSVAEGLLDDAGTTRLELSVPRFTRTTETGRLIDCASGCRLSTVVDGSQVGLDLAFDPGSAPRPEATLTFDGEPVPGRRVTVEGRGFVPLTRVDSYICSTPITRDTGFWIDPINRCGWPADGLWVDPISISPDGAMRGEIVAPRDIELWSWDAPHNCVIQECWLVITTGDAPGTTPVGSLRIDFG